MSVNDKTGDTACTCAALRRAARRVTRLYDQALAPAGLRITQYPVLARLAASGPATMTALAAALGLDRATLGHNLRPLEARGLVTLTAGADKRSRMVTLTEAGRQKLAEARPAWDKAQAMFESAFGAPDTAALRVTLGRVARLDFPAGKGVQGIGPRGQLTGQ